MAFKRKTKKINSLQSSIQGNLDNNEDSKRDIHGSNVHGEYKRQDPLSKLGAWGTVKLEGRGKDGSEEKYIAQLKQLKSILT